jgi:hypothetical protein
MISAETGEETRNVNGSSIEIVATGPSPGRTPTRVPIKTPIRQCRRFTGCRDMENP